MSIQELQFGNTLVSDEARDLTDQATAVFRRWLNHRMFPMTPKQVRALAPYERPDHVWEHTCPVCGRELHRDGCVRHGVIKHESRNARYGSPAKPERSMVVWTKWLNDHETELVIVERTRDGDAQVTTSVGESGSKPSKIVEYWVLMTEQVHLPADTPGDREILNRDYFGWDAPLNYRPKTGYFSKKLGRFVATWRVTEPFGAVVGPLTSYDVAEQRLKDWAREINDDRADIESGAFDHWHMDPQ